VSRGWHAAFVAVTVALGDSVDDALGSLGATEASLPPDGAALVKALRSESRDTRVRALAHALSEVALDVEAMGLS
jgi:hypothetical protein